MCGYPELKGDGFCNDENNNYLCGYDGGDCCNNDNANWNVNCTLCKCFEGICQPINGL